MTDLIGIATWNFRTGTLAGRIDRFADMGYNAMSLNTRDAAPLARGEMPDVDAVLVGRGLPVTIHGGLAAKGEPISRDAILADFQGYADWHARTGLLMSVNYDAPKRQTAEGSWEISAEETRDILGEMLSISEAAGFTVGIEDWPRAAEDLHWVEDLRSSPHFGMLIDLGHLNMRIPKADDPVHPFSIDAAREYLDRMVLPVNELHVHNNDGVKDLHAPPDVGTADLRAVASLLASSGKLRSRGPRCVSTIELVPGWCGLSDEEGFAASQRALDFWRTAIA